MSLTTPFTAQKTITGFEDMIKPLLDMRPAKYAYMQPSYFKRYSNGHNVQHGAVA